MDGKRLALLHEMMPNVARVGLLLDPNFPAYATQLNELQQAAAIINLQAEILRAGTDGENRPPLKSAEFSSGLDKAQQA